MEARAMLGIAAGRRYPQLQAAFASVSGVNLSENVANNQAFDRDFWDFQLGFDVAWEADFWGKFSRTVKAEQAAYLSSVADYQQALVSLSAEVARTYAVIRTFEVLIEQARRNVAVQEEGFQIADARFRNGATSELDVTQARTLLENTRASIPQLEISLVQSKNALSTLLGQTPGRGRRLVAGAAGDPGARLASSGEHSRGDVATPSGHPQRRARRDVAIGAHRHSEGGACTRASFSTAHWASRGPLAASRRSRSVCSIPPAFSSPWVRRSTGPSSITAAWRIRCVSRMRASSSCCSAIRTVCSRRRRKWRMRRGLPQGAGGRRCPGERVTAARRSVELAFLQYREGAVDFLRVLDAERTQLQEENTLARIRSSVVTNLISLYKALGGGWETSAGSTVHQRSDAGRDGETYQLGRLLRTGADHQRGRARDQARD